MAKDYPSWGKGGRKGNKLGMKSGGEKSIAMIDTEYGRRTQVRGVRGIPEDLHFSYSVTLH